MRKLIQLIILITIHISSVNLYAGTYSGGSGTVADPYKIGTAADLIELSRTHTDWSVERNRGRKYFIQTADIVFDANPQNVDWDRDGSASWDAEDQLGFNPIGHLFYSAVIVYEGNSYTISNLYINNPLNGSRYHVGLFGCLWNWESGNPDNNSIVRNLGLINVNIVGPEYVGALCGGTNGYISNCYSTGSVIGGGTVGGLIGEATAGSITNCFSTANVSSGSNAGGFCGSGGAIINNCYSTGNVSSSGGVSEDTYGVGGFIGIIWGNEESPSVINNCYSTGNVSTNPNYTGGFAGGFVGFVENSTISNCYSLSNVVTSQVISSGENLGCFCGMAWVSNVSFSNCYSTGSLTSTSLAEENIIYKLFVNIINTENIFSNCIIEINEGETPLTCYADIITHTRAEMKTQSTFSAWDFGTDSTDWVMSSPIAFGGYPTLRWTGGYSVEPTGTPKQIASLPNLVWVAEAMSISPTDENRWSFVEYTQTANINMWTVPSWDGNKGWTPIGSPGQPFSLGAYNGGGYTISNLFINRSSTEQIGFFGYPDYSSISNVGLKNVNITGQSNVGALIGYSANEVSVYNCYSTGSVTGTSTVGGMVGYNLAYCTIDYSFSSCNVYGTNFSGGLVGYNNNATISNSYSNGNVTRSSGINTAFGGFCGYNASTIHNCYSTSKVYSSTGTIWNVESNKDKGFIGLDGLGGYSNNFFDATASEQTSGTGANARTTAQMKTQATFIGWDFLADPNKVWNIQSGEYISYPYLQAFTYDTPGAIMQINPIPGLGLPLVISTPNTQASGIEFSNITRTGMTVRWAKGDGVGSILLAKEQYRIATNPLTDGVVYDNPNTNYTSAPSVGGAKLLYNGTAVNPSVNVSGLTKYKLYYFRAFAYNNAAAPYYLQTENATNPRSRWTLRRDGMMEEDLTIDAEYAYPNPASNSISTTLDMFEAGVVSAKLYDAAGRIAAELFNQSMPFGTHELKFDISTVSSGVYQLIISKGSEAIIYPVSVVK